MLGSCVINMTDSWSLRDYLLLRGLLFSQVQPERKHPRHRLVNVLDAVLERENVIRHSLLIGLRPARVSSRSPTMLDNGRGYLLCFGRSMDQRVVVMPEMIVGGFKPSR